MAELEGSWKFDKLFCPSCGNEVMIYPHGGGLPRLMNGYYNFKCGCIPCKVVWDCVFSVDRTETLLNFSATLRLKRKLDDKRETDASRDASRGTSDSNPPVESATNSG
jgi:hypothetical protein